MDALAEDPVVFRSNHPEVIAAWDEVQAQMVSYREREKALIKELKPKGRKHRDPLHQRHFSSFPMFECFSVVDGDAENPPEGWAVKRRRAGGMEGLYLEPDKRRKAGQLIARKIQDLHRSAPTDPRWSGAIPGVPRAFLSAPGVERHGEYLYLIYGAGKSVEGVGSKEGYGWIKIKLSEYYLAKEADEAGV